MSRAVYANRNDMLVALSLDSQARLTNDPLRKWIVGTGDGATTTFTTPFIETTTLKGYVNGAEVTPAPTVSRGTGSNGRDQAVFGTAPAAASIVAVAADRDAINVDVLDRALLQASEAINGYLYALLPVTDPDLLESLRGKAVLLAKMSLRGRRNLDVVDPVEMEWKAAMRWLEGVAKGDIPISQGTPDAEPDGSDGDYAYGSFDPVFATDEGMP